jgi:hypothetical protein
MRTRLLASAVSAGFLAAMAMRGVLMGLVAAGTLPGMLADMPVMCLVEGVCACAAAVAVLALLPRSERWRRGISRRSDIV